MSRFILFLFIMANSITSGQQLDTTRLHQTIQSFVDNKLVFGAQVTIQHGTEQWTSSSGNLGNDQQYFIASTTKMYTTAIILRLQDEGKLSLDDKINTYLTEETIQGLHMYKGIDYSEQLTIKHLLAHTSGLPDYFEDKQYGKPSLIEEITAGKDQGWSFEDAIRMSKSMQPLFPPGKKNKAHYSDTNFQLLGRIIETITGKTYNEALTEYIITPLGLRKTYLYQDHKDTIPALMYFKSQPLNIPIAMTKFGPDGGIVSNSEESVRFIHAFFNGELFSKNILDELYIWNRIMFPLQNGVGLMRYRLPRIFTIVSTPEALGHSGLSGAFAYYIPEKDLYIAGTVNQIHKPGTTYRMLSKLMNQVR